MKKPRIPRILAAWFVILVAVPAVHGQDRLTEAVAHRFPREMLVNSARVVLHAPQVESWKDYETVVTWHALEVTFLDEGKPHVGAVKTRARTQVDKESRTVFVYDKEVLEIHFSGTPPGQAELVGGAARAAIQSDRGTVPLDLALAYIARQQKEAESTTVESDPPIIHTADSPTLLVLIEGEPAFAPMEGVGLRYALNTNWGLFLHESSGSYYLRDDELWLTASDLKGSWKKAGELPDDFSRLPATNDWAEARNAIPLRASDRAAPRVLINTQPAELLLTDGPPVFREFPGTLLAYVDNTQNDVFMELSTGTYYFLVAGRWFKASRLQGPWAAAGTLPGDFAKIPPKGPRADVLASVPGTWEARLAVQEARIPRKASVDPAKASLEVVYHGDPRFESIPGTSVSRAVNTPDQVLQAKGNYFACKLGVWFASSSPTGRWVVAREVPDVIYSIPSSSPAYPVTFVRIHEHGRGRTTFGYTSGYERIYVAKDVVVFGTGHYYHPYLSRDERRPIYYPGFSPYGVGAYYDLNAGSYRRVLPGPYSGADVQDVGVDSVYAAWGADVAIPEDQRIGKAQRLASRAPGPYGAPPEPEDWDPGAAEDLYVGPDHEVYQRQEEDWVPVNPYVGQDVSGGLSLDEDRHARSYLERRRAQYNARKNLKRRRQAAW